MLIERTGDQRRLFEPIPADQISGLPALLKELEFVDWCSEDLQTSRLV